MPWFTYIALSPADRDLLEPILADIGRVDPTFQWEIFATKYLGGKPRTDGKLREYAYIAKIKSRTHVQAHRRGCWLVHKTGIPDLLYWTKKE